MRYQERIYIQNDNRGVRNKDILNVNMSSDICIFKSPTFDVSGATKVQCDSVDCNLSGVSLSNIFSAVTATCYTTATSICHSATTWETKIYADSELVSTKQFYSTETFGEIPLDIQFLNSIVLSFRNLGYSYTKDGYTFNIDKPYGVKSLEIDVCVSVYVIPFTCPIGYSATPANDACQKIISTGATNNGLGSIIMSGNQNSVYGTLGAYFYPNIQSNGALPLNYTTGGILKDTTGGTITALNVNNSLFWGNPFSFSGTGRLNNVGLSASTTEWLGFSKCIDIPVAGTYYIGIAADNFCRFKLNGDLLVSFSGGGGTGSGGRAWLVWNVFPLDLKSGLNIIEMEGLNDGSSTAFGAEIYYPTGATPYATLTAATSTASTEANVIFSTKDRIGGYWDLGTTIGYSCPSGYVLNKCGTAYTCTEIITIDVCDAASCVDNCTTVCNDTFPYIDNTSQGVYILNTTQSSIPFTFTFTGNTSTFLDTNASFKYEVYRYLSNSNVFKLPAVYKSDVIPYSTFSATSAITVSIPTSNLGLDGEYIIKGYFESEACTDFLGRLGKKLDTSLYKTTGVYGIYEPETDYYFLAMKEAETPVFNGTSSDEAIYSPISLYQQVIYVDFTQEGNYSPEADDYSETSLYERTGSTFVLSSEYNGDVMVTLNGLTLAKDIDYTLSGQVLTFLGPISNNDVITLFYTRTTTTTLVSNTVLVNTTIPSGATDSQGTSKYYYNTTTGKYEVYTTNEPINGGRIIVMLNGVTLADGIDYYRSTSNEKRIILNGSLMIGDILNLIYYPKAVVIEGITQTNTYVGWNIENGPTLQNGEFSLQYSSDINFSSYVTSAVVPYQINVTDYGAILSLSGDVGTKLYYRVKNTKNFESICGDPIQSIAYSEKVPVVIQTNAINSY